jgi:glycine dehydrogenase
MCLRIRAGIRSIRRTNLKSVRVVYVWVDLTYVESLLNFYTMVCDLTGMPIANASLLDEGTAAAEAMILSFSASKSNGKTFLVDRACHPQTISCVQMRAEGFGINVVVEDLVNVDLRKYEGVMGALIQYPNTFGDVVDYEGFVERVHGVGALVSCATDLLSLTRLKPPGEFGADIVLGKFAAVWCSTWIWR